MTEKCTLQKNTLRFREKKSYRRRCSGKFKKRCGNRNCRKRHYFSLFSGRPYFFHCTSNRFINPACLIIISAENMQDFTNGDMFRKKSFQNFTFYFSNSIDYRGGCLVYYYTIIDVLILNYLLLKFL